MADLTDRRHCATCTCTSSALDPDRPWHQHDLIDIRRYGGGLICPAEYNTNDDEGLSCLIEGHHDGRPHESLIGPWCSACGRWDTHTEECPDHDAPDLASTVKVLFTGDRPSDSPTYWCVPSGGDAARTISDPPPSERTDP